MTDKHNTIHNTTTTYPPCIGIMYCVRFVRHCLTIQAPLPPTHRVLVLCIVLGLSVIDQSSTTTTYPPCIGIMYCVRFVCHYLTIQVPLPRTHSVLVLCIVLGLFAISDHLSTTTHRVTVL